VLFDTGDILVYHKNVSKVKKKNIRLSEGSIFTKVLRRIFGPWRDEVKGEWRRLHNEELNDQYSS